MQGELAYWIHFKFNNRSHWHLLFFHMLFFVYFACNMGIYQRTQVSVGGRCDCAYRPKHFHENLHTMSHEKFTFRNNYLLQKPREECMNVE